MAATVTSEQIMKALEKVFDPEVGINLVDLGLIYEVNINGQKVDVKMTLTTPGCPLHESISKGAENAVRGVPGVEEAKVSVVWEPRWTPDRMSENAKKILGYR